jgi:hypothetical protein
MTKTVAERFDDMCDESLAEDFGGVVSETPRLSVSGQIMVALEFLSDLHKQGRCGAYGCVSWSEKDGLSVMFPHPKVRSLED